MNDKRKKRRRKKNSKQKKKKIQKEILQRDFLAFMITSLYMVEKKMQYEKCKAFVGHGIVFHETIIKPFVRMVEEMKKSYKENPKDFKESQVNDISKQIFPKLFKYYTRKQVFSLGGKKKVVTVDEKVNFLVLVCKGVYDKYEAYTKHINIGNKNGWPKVISSNLVKEKHKKKSKIFYEVDGDKLIFGSNLIFFDHYEDIVKIAHCAGSKIITQYSQDTLNIFFPPIVQSTNNFFNIMHKFMKGIPYGIVHEFVSKHKSLFKDVYKTNKDLVIEQLCCLLVGVATLAQKRQIEDEYLRDVNISTTYVLKVTIDDDNEIVEYVIPVDVMIEIMSFIDVPKRMQDISVVCSSFYLLVLKSIESVVVNRTNGLKIPTLVCQNCKQLVFNLSNRTYESGKVVLPMHMSTIVNVYDRFFVEYKNSNLSVLKIDGDVTRFVQALRNHIKSGVPMFPKIRKLYLCFTHSIPVNKHAPMFLKMFSIFNLERCTYLEIRVRDKIVELKVMYKSNLIEHTLLDKLIKLQTEQ